MKPSLFDETEFFELENADSGPVRKVFVRATDVDRIVEMKGQAETCVVYLANGEGFRVKTTYEAMKKKLIDGLNINEQRAFARNAQETGEEELKGGER